MTTYCAGCGGEETTAIGVFAHRPGCILLRPTPEPTTMNAETPPKCPTCGRYDMLTRHNPITGTTACLFCKAQWKTAAPVGPPAVPEWHLCANCDRPELCKIIKPGTAPCRENRPLRSAVAQSAGPTPRVREVIDERGGRNVFVQAAITGDVREAFLLAANVASIIRDEYEMLAKGENNAVRKERYNRDATVARQVKGQILAYAGIQEWPAPKPTASPAVAPAPPLDATEDEGTRAYQLYCTAYNDWRRGTDGKSWPQRHREILNDFLSRRAALASPTATNLQKPLSGFSQTPLSGTLTNLVAADRTEGKP